ENGSVRFVASLLVVAGVSLLLQEGHHFAPGPHEGSTTEDQRCGEAGLPHESPRGRPTDAAMEQKVFDVPEDGVAVRLARAPAASIGRLHLRCIAHRIPPAGLTDLTTGAAGSAIGPADLRGHIEARRLGG